MAALHERRSLLANGQAPIPRLEGIRPALQNNVDSMYRAQVRYMLGGLLDHLEGRSLWRPAVNPVILRLARDSGLIKPVKAGK